MNLEELRFRKLEEHVQLLRQRVDALEGRGNIHITDQEPPFFTPGSETMTQPAMTPEEWAAKTFYTVGCYFGQLVEDVNDADEVVEVLDAQKSFEGQERQKLAALALHGQEFGFTWEMVDALRCAVASASRFDHPEFAEDERLAETAIDRIEALLPPRTP